MVGTALGSWVGRRERLKMLVKVHLGQDAQRTRLRLSSPETRAPKQSLSPGGSLYSVKLALIDEWRLDLAEFSDSET